MAALRFRFASPAASHGAGGSFTLTNHTDHSVGAGHYLAEYDFNLPIDDAAADPDLPVERARLALLARGEGLDAGYYEAQELAEAFLDMAREANAGNEDPDSPARERMADILDRAEGYQRALFDQLAALPLSEAAAHLCWLAELMKNRADMYRPVMAARNKTR